MHCPDNSPRHSIYYDYQVFPAYESETENQVERIPVIIVGAGPVGLTTALSLAEQGVESVILEAELQVSAGSRAIVFTQRSMEIFQTVGADRAVVENGLPWNIGKSFYKNHQVFRMEAPIDEGSRFAPMTNLQQQYIEEYLLDKAVENPLISIRWGNKLADFSDQGDHVSLEVESPVGAYRMTADWLVASDGARSGVRSKLGLKMYGKSYSGNFVIADIKIDLDLPTERLAFFEPDWSPGNTVLMHREPHGIWRVDYQLPEDVTPEQALETDQLSACINAQLEMIGHGDKSWELDWCSVYSARTLTLGSYVENRVIFVGDAAHLLPIFGVRGANTGFQDAQNLGWKLGLVNKGVAGPGLLESYSQERVEAAEQIIDEAGKSTRFMTPPTTGYRLLRDAVLSLAVTESFVRPLFHWRTSSAHSYRQSALNCADVSAAASLLVMVGDVLPNAKISDDRYLLDQVSNEFVVLLCTESSDLVEQVAKEVSSFKSEGVPISLQILTAPLSAAFGMKEGSAYLVRPDQHVCSRWSDVSAENVRDAVLTALCLKEQDNV